MAEPESEKVRLAREMLAEAVELAAHAELLRHAAAVNLERAKAEDEQAAPGNVRELHPNSEEGGGDERS